MKKIINIVIIIIIVTILIFPTKIYAIDNLINIVDEFEKMGDEPENVIDVNELKETSNYIYNLLLTIGIAVAVVVGAILGIKTIMATVEEKAKLKEMFIPYLIGCVIIFAAFPIWKFVIQFEKQVEKDQHVIEGETNYYYYEKGKNEGRAFVLELAETYNIVPKNKGVEWLTEGKGWRELDCFCELVEDNYGNVVEIKYNSDLYPDDSFEYNIPDQFDGMYYGTTGFTANTYYIGIDFDACYIYYDEFRDGVRPKPTEYNTEQEGYSKYDSYEIRLKKFMADFESKKEEMNNEEGQNEYEKQYLEGYKEAMNYALQTEITEQFREASKVLQGKNITRGLLKDVFFDIVERRAGLLDDENGYSMPEIQILYRNRKLLSEWKEAYSNGLS